MILQLKLFKKIVQKYLKRASKQQSPEHNWSYSQGGEDIIVSRILGKLKIFTPTYLDIGASHPIQLNNTYKFYEKGSRGVLVEANPILCETLRQIRPEDTVLNIGIGSVRREHAEFYIMSNHYLSTFSKESAEEIASYGKNKIEKVAQIPLVPINVVLAENFDRCPNFISLDVEGYDFEILNTFDFSTYRPEVFCLETITYTEDNTEQKETEILAFMDSHGYMVYGDTYINTIFVDHMEWKKR